MSPKKFQDGDLVVNFHDACIYGRDLALLESPTEWLNDACLHFALTDLQVSLDQVTQGDTLLLDPAVVAFLMHQCHDEDDFGDFCRGCREFKGIYRLVIPVNDTLTSSNWAVPGKGTHWSLLVIERGGGENSNIFGYHFDSVATSGNLRVAQAVADKVVLASKGAFASYAPSVRLCRTPLQRNSYDCGVHVIAVAKAVVSLEVSRSTDSPEDYESTLTDLINAHDEPCLVIRSKLATRIRQLASQAK